MLQQSTVTQVMPERTSPIEPIASTITGSSLHLPLHHLCVYYSENSLVPNIFLSSQETFLRPYLIFVVLRLKVFCCAVYIGIGLRFFLSLFENSEKQSSIEQSSISKDPQLMQQTNRKVRPDLNQPTRNCCDSLLLTMFPLIFHSPDSADPSKDLEDALTRITFFEVSSKNTHKFSSFTFVS